MKDLLFFVCFILIFLFGFSITSWSFIIAPNQLSWIYDSQGYLTDITFVNPSDERWSWRILYDVTNYGIWKIFGQVETVGKSTLFSVFENKFHFSI